jgi:hypothetical protein
MKVDAKDACANDFGRLTPRKRSFEWWFGENDARTMAYEVQTAAAPERGIPS